MNGSNTNTTSTETSVSAGLVTVGSTETSPLLTAASSLERGEMGSGGGDSPASVNSDQTVMSQRLWEELEHPWPSTFERSIALLASPMIQAEQVEVFTKSPRPGSTPLALARRTNLDKGFYTPERNSLFPPPRRTGGEKEPSFRLGLTKVQSLDLGFNMDQVKKVQTEQQRKAQEAKAYRSKILSTQAAATTTTTTTTAKTKASKQQEQFLSPGYQREVTSKKRQQQEKAKMDVEAALAGGGSKATFLQCSFNMANILMGVGLLGLPYVFKSAGWFGGFFCLLFFAFMTWRTSILIGRELNGDPRPAGTFIDSPFKSPLPPGSTPEARMLPPIHSFPDIARSSFGNMGCLLLSSVLYFELFSCVCIFFVAIGDHLHMLFPAISVAHHLMMTAAVSLIPTALLRTPALLSYFSMVGTFATMTLVLAVVASALSEGDMTETLAQAEDIPETGPFRILWRPSGLTMALGLVAYCFSGHAIVPSIYQSMERPQDFEKMVTATFLVVTFCSLAVSVSGYYMFGSLVEDQVTLSLEENSKAGAAMKALTWLMILTAFSKVTLTMFPLALGIEEIVAPYLTSEKWVDAASALIKLCLSIAALLVSIFVPSFSLLCALVGMICTMVVSVIFPAAAHLKMFGPKLSIFEKAADVLFVVFGVFMAIVGTIATV